MMKPINIIDSDYAQWIKELSSRYRRSQIKAAVKVNQEMLQFYWELGRDIVERDAENHYGSRFYPSLSRDLRAEIQDASGLSERNLRYTKKFYLFFESLTGTLQQVVADSMESSSQPIAISEYDLEKFFPEKLEGIIPTIEEIETKLKETTQGQIPVIDQ